MKRINSIKKIRYKTLTKKHKRTKKKQIHKNKSKKFKKKQIRKSKKLKKKQIQKGGELLINSNHHLLNIEEEGE